MATQFIDAVLLGNFEKAVILLPGLRLIEPFNKALHREANDGPNFAAYAFLHFLMTRPLPKEQRLECYSDVTVMLEFEIQYLVGAYETAAHYERMLFESPEFDNSLNGGKGLLLLYTYPEQPISTAEAIDVAKKILEMEPENAPIKKILQTALSRTDEPIALPRNEREQLERLIRGGLLSKAKELLPAISTRELYEVLLYLGCEERNLCAYTFTWFLMQEREDAELHYIAYRIVTLAWPPLNMKGCYATGAFHLRRAMHLDPTNIKYAEHFLMLHTPPEHSSHVIDDEEAEAIARRTLASKYGTFSAAAKRVLKKLGKSE